MIDPNRVDEIVALLQRRNQIDNLEAAGIDVYEFARTLADTTQSISVEQAKVHRVFTTRRVKPEDRTDMVAQLQSSGSLVDYFISKLLDSDGLDEGLQQTIYEESARSKDDGASNPQTVDDPQALAAQNPSSLTDLTGIAGPQGAMDSVTPQSDPLVTGSRPKFEATPSTDKMSSYRADKRIMLFTQGEQLSGALPKSMPSNMLGDDFKRYITDQLTEQERLAFKRALYVAGYYGQAAWENRSFPETGSWDSQTDGTAIDLLLSDVQNKRYGDTLNSTLLYKTKLEAPNLRSITNATLGVDVQTANLQDFSEKMIGRRLKQDEIVNIVNTVLGFKDQSMLPTREGEAVLQGGQLLSGGGKDSTALQYGNQLARAWGLQPIQGYVPAGANPPSPEYSQGRGLRVTGPDNYLLGFYSWAETQIGKDKLFASITPQYGTDKKTPVSVSLVFNDGVVAPSFGSQSPIYTQDTEIQRFIDSVRRPGEWLAYNWDGDGPANRGAYSINENIYKKFANDLGIAADDYSIAAQDAVARSYSQWLFDKYHSWDLVAVALKYGEPYAIDLQNSGGVSASNDDTVKQWTKSVTDRMSQWKPRWFSPTTSQPDVSSQGLPAFQSERYSNIINSPAQLKTNLEQEFRKQKKSEIFANDIADAIIWMVKNNSLQQKEFL